MVAIAPTLTPLVSTDVSPSGAPILVASDGDAALVDALCSAARLAAAALGGTPAVVGVSEALPGVAAGFDALTIPVTLDEERRTTLQADLERALSIAAAADPSWTVTTRTGSPSRVLADEATTRGASLLVMGIGRHNPLDRLFGTETTLATLRESRVPILAVPSHFVGAPMHAVAGLDFSAASIEAARLALRMLAPGGRLTLVHVRPRFAHPSADWQAWDVEYGRTLPPLFAQVREQLAAPEGVTVETVTVRGDPAQALLAFAHNADAGLVAVGTQRHSLVERLVVGSVATRVLRAARSAVLAVPARR